MGTFEAGLTTFCNMIWLQACGGQGVECGTLNVIGPQKLIGSGNIRRYGLVEVSMALLEEVCHCVVGF